MSSRRGARRAKSRGPIDRSGVSGAPRPRGRIRRDLDVGPGQRSSMRDWGQRFTSLVKTSVSQRCGVTALRLQVSMRDAMIAQLAPPSLLPANRAFFRLSAFGRRRAAVARRATGAGLRREDGFGAAVPNGARPRFGHGYRLQPPRERRCGPEPRWQSEHCQHWRCRRSGA